MSSDNSSFGDFIKAIFSGIWAVCKWIYENIAWVIGFTLILNVFIYISLSTRKIIVLKDSSGWTTFMAILNFIVLVIFILKTANTSGDGK
jgi:hypothetical protein